MFLLERWRVGRRLVTLLRRVMGRRRDARLRRANRLVRGRVLKRWAIFEDE